MDILSTLKAVFALAIVIGLIMGLAYVLRRYAPGLMARMQDKRGARRLTVVETLVLVRLDNQERLILLGEGRELTSPDQTPAKPIDVRKPTALDPNDDLF